ncbi:hypothetical protein CDAR_189161 [Caerostris darwini]|uniref:Ribosomal protein S14 n=1 Tax=Caerostris darwini TaxID=1538125 RepID=A0AAV4SRA2_9ARAC|nr:hypothetical protein CDAR_189161 [Caerostris darwini]
MNGIKQVFSRKNKRKSLSPAGYKRIQPPLLPLLQVFSMENPVFGASTFFRVAAAGKEKSRNRFCCRRRSGGVFFVVVLRGMARAAKMKSTLYRAQGEKSFGENAG